MARPQKHTAFIVAKISVDNMKIKVYDLRSIDKCVKRGNQ